jgi:tRNA (adenine37-N6)-methyltransferase
MPIPDNASGHPEIMLRPVGVVRSKIDTPTFLPFGDDDPAARMKKARKQHQRIKALIADVVIDPGLEGILEGIEDFSNIMVLYWPHRIPEERRSLRQVHPMGRKDIPLKGIFATRSPARPNPVLVSVVRLVERDGNILRVQGLEALDGSPVIDVKPFTGIYDAPENPSFPDWLKQLHADLETRDNDPDGEAQDNQASSGPGDPAGGTENP